MKACIFSNQQKYYFNVSDDLEIQDLLSIAYNNYKLLPFEIDEISLYSSTKDFSMISFTYENSEWIKRNSN
jgi:hypothetical protein